MQLLARFVAGVAVAGVFVVVESWLLHGNEADRAKRVGLYMGFCAHPLEIGIRMMTAK
ncbi:MAG: hypothetical protein ABGX03_06495 [Methylophilaceae bacterium]